MYKFKILKLFVFILVCVFLFGCADDSSSDREPAKGTGWTVMIYLDADNNLELFAMYDVEEMKQLVQPEVVLDAIEEAQPEV